MKSVSLAEVVYGGFKSHLVKIAKINTGLFRVARLILCTYLYCIHPGRVGPASPVDLITSRIETSQARRCCVSSLETFTHRAQTRRSYTDGMQSLRLTSRMRRMLSLSKTTVVLSSATRTDHVSQQ